MTQSTQDDLFGEMVETLKYVVATDYKSDGPYCGIQPAHDYSEVREKCRVMLAKIKP